MQTVVNLYNQFYRAIKMNATTWIKFTNLISSEINKP